MSTKELAYSILDSLSEEQLKGFIMLFFRQRRNKTKGRNIKGAVSRKRCRNGCKIRKSRSDSVGKGGMG